MHGLELSPSTMVFITSVIVRLGCLLFFSCVCESPSGRLLLEYGGIIARSSALPRLAPI